MVKKLIRVLHHYTRQGNESGKKKLYSCNYCKWKTVVNVTRMDDHLTNKCTKCPTLVKKLSKTKGAVNFEESFNIDDDEPETQCATTSTIEVTNTNTFSQEVQEQKKVTPTRQRNMMNFVDFITEDEQVSE